MIAGLAAVLAAGLAGALVYLRRCWVAVQVVGISMQPSFVSGEWVLVRRCTVERLRRGDVVVFGGFAPAAGQDPQDRAVTPRWLVKRVAAVPGDAVPRELAGSAGIGDLTEVPCHSVLVLGDNADFSVDSRTWGPVPADQVLGVLRRRLRGLAGEHPGSSARA